MLNLIKGQLKKIPILLYTYRVLKLYKNDDFREIINTNSMWKLMLLKMDNYGEKIYYFIDQGNGVGGFFAVFLHTVNALAYADCFRFSPYVYYNKNFLCSEPETFMGTDNAFEYYFEQISPEYTAPGRHNAVTYKRFEDEEYIYLGLETTGGVYGLTKKGREDYISRVAGLVKKYIRFNSQTKEYLDENINRMLHGKKTLGVHARGGEWRKPVKNHPVSVSAGEHIKQAKQAMGKYGFEQIFLATDEQETLDAFVKEFHNKVIYYKDTFRGQEGTWLAATESSREHHHYKLGLEVLRDAETLAHCDGLIAGLSNVAMYAEIKKKVDNQQYEYLYINNKGVNQAGATSEQIKKQNSIGKLNLL